MIAFLDDAEIDRIVDKVLRQCFKGDAKRMPRGYNDYNLMFTEGGELSAVASAVAIAQHRKSMLYVGKLLCASLNKGDWSWI
jgi:hypothetical protein